jgi:DNA polymerase-3 subunit delta'
LLARRDKLPHALLFRGREGIGKRALAEALARALLCEKRQPGAGACGRCVACNWMEQGSHPDFRRLEPEILSDSRDAEEGTERKPSLEIRIEQVRDIAGLIAMTTHRNGPRVILIHPAEALNMNAANALLKNLEEPPPQTYFLLVSHRWHQLPATIRSRCEQVVLAPPTRETAREWLAQQKLSDADLALAHAGSAPLLAAAFDEDYWHQREMLLKAITQPRFDSLASAEMLRETAPALVVSCLQKWASDLVRHKVTGEVSYNPDYADAVASAAARIGLVEAVRYLRHVVRHQRIVAHPLNARLFLEQLLLEYGALLRHAG